MDQNEYLEKRVDDQIAWYDKKSQSNQKIFKCLRIIEVAFAALIPWLSGYSAKEERLDVIIGVLGFTIAVIAGLLSLYHFQENWIEYRTTCETLRHEKYLFLTGAAEYDADEPFKLFVQRIEGIISKQHSQWTENVKKDKKE